MQVPPSTVHMSLDDVDYDDIMVNSTLDALTQSPSIVEVPPQKPTSTTEAQIKNTIKPKGSNMWKYFEKIDRESAKCKTCSKIIRNDRNTTNLKNHLNSKHPLLLSPEKRKLDSNPGNFPFSSDEKKEIANRKKRLKIEEKENIITHFRRIDSMKEGETGATRLTEKIMYMIVTDHQPLSMVESEGFSELIKFLVPHYKLPSRQTITRLIDAKYSNMKIAVKNQLALAPSHAITCDIWTDCKMQSYLGVTDHYLTPTFSLNHITLGTIPLASNHTGDLIEEKLREVLSMFDIDLEKVVCVTSDSAGNMKKGILQLVGSEKHVPCVAHILSHIVPDALQSLTYINDILSQVRSIVRKVKNNVNAGDELKKLQMQNGLSEGQCLRFLLDMKVRWNSTYFMAARYIELKNYVYTVLLKCPDAPDPLSRDQIQVLEDLVLIFKPIQNVITEISGDSYSTGSIAIPIIRGLKLCISKLKPNTKMGKDLMLRISEALEKRFKELESNQVLAVATILDPRFKKLAFESRLKCANAINKINRLMNVASIKENVGQTAKNSGPIENNEDNDIWSFHDHQNEVQTSGYEPGSNGDEIHIELQQYINQPRIPRKNDPLGYWKMVQTAFPTLSKIAIFYANAVTSSVPSERLFSEAGIVVTDRRNRLTGERVNILLFLSSLPKEMWDCGP
ncbi:zinc finger BED domain-containing protein 4-like [Linepithema humile]|uniref:zinc finger BED domain-containing protein 4-like n=1 Tax=Linepithema humile TaxID=83485 RepID=UPI0006237A34|nr:PREDICTED: zinc finger BED domain-containing protein 4-like [Linepithema humile]XP_012221277.1 PREDICTED: zinc finger BED domain-containing protein 4-like [Linepithema humile]